MQKRCKTQKSSLDSLLKTLNKLILGIETLSKRDCEPKSWRVEGCRIQKKQREKKNLSLDSWNKDIRIDEWIYK